MREEMVQNGVKFLQHPNVQTTPLSERVSFLEKKGLTKQEIQESIERTQGSKSSSHSSTPINQDEIFEASVMSDATSSLANSPPQQQVGYPQTPPLHAPYPMQQLATPASLAHAAMAVPAHLIRRSKYPPYLRIFLMVSSIFGAASFVRMLWKAAVHWGLFSWMKSPLLIEAEKIKEQEEEENQKEVLFKQQLDLMSTQMSTQTQQIQRLSHLLETKEQEANTNQTISAQIMISMAQQSTSQAISELKTEMSTLRILLDNQKDKSHSPHNSNIMPFIEASATTTCTPTATSSSSKNVSRNTNTTTTMTLPVPQVSNLTTKIDRLEKALVIVQEKNSIEALQQAASVLIMYVKNLVENPDVPRYRRIAPANNNFKQKIEPLEHHEELLKAIGFESNGVNMEWKWHTGNNSNSQEEQEENLAILKAMLKALQSLSIMESTSSLADIMREQVDAYKAVIEEKPSVSTDAITTTDTTTSSTTNSTPSVEFPCKQSSDLDSFMAKLEQKAAAVNASPNRMNSPVLSSVERPTFLLEEEKEEVKESVGDGPSYPKSFTEVMQMIQRGEQVPGIQEIEDKLSEDSSLFLTQESIGSVEALGEVGEQIVGAGTKPWERTTS